MLLTHLCTYNDFLPQGAPTSSSISNLVMREFDEEIGSWCEEQDISYTRYSDDLTFSGDFIPRNIIIKVRKKLNSLGMTLNNKKTHVIHQSSNQNVTGITVNEKTQVCIKKRKELRQEIYYIKKYGLISHLQKKNLFKDYKRYLNSLYGKILFILQINNKDKEFLEYKRFIAELKKNYKYN